MGFNFWRWIFGKKVSEKVDMKTICHQLTNEIMARELAMNIVANKVGNAVSKCEFRIYYENKRIKDEEWYRWRY